MLSRFAFRFDGPGEREGEGQGKGGGKRGTEEGKGEGRGKKWELDKEKREWTGERREREDGRGKRGEKCFLCCACLVASGSEREGEEVSQFHTRMRFFLF